MKQWLWLILVVMIIAGLFGCGEDNLRLGETTWITETTLSSITVEPASATISVGRAQQYKATGTYSDGSTADIPTIPWTSSDQTVATIDESGKATGVAEGVTTIKARISGVEGSSRLTVSSVVLPAVWQHAAGSGGRISSLAIDLKRSQTVYAGGNGGVRKTTDGGISWSVINNGLTNNYINPLAIDPANGQAVYAGIGAGSSDGGDIVFKTTDGGASWAPINNGLLYGLVGVLVVDPADSQVVYAGITTAGGCGGGPCSDTGSLFKSTNGGRSWTSIRTGTAVYSLAIDPTRSQTAYAGTDTGGVFKTTDGGTSWTAINVGLTPNGRVNSLAIDPSNSQVVYAAIGAGSAFKTIDGGISWTAVNAGLATNRNVNSLAIDPSNSQVVYAGTNDGVFKTIDGGISWSVINTGLTNHFVHSLAINPANSRVVYAGTDDGVFKLIE